MQIKFTNKGTTLVVGIIGELDHHSEEYLRRKMDAEIVKATTKHMVIDLSKVSFMDSSGIGVIAGRYKNVRKLDGNMAVVNPSPQIKRIFEMSGLLKIIPVYENLDKALNSINHIA